MKIFAYNISGIRNHQGISLLSVLNKLGVNVIEEGREQIMDLDKIDFVLVEGTSCSEQIPYIIALALAKNKPVLYLLKKGAQVYPSVLNICQDKTVASKIFIIKYGDKSLIGDLSEGLEKIETKGLKEIPSIKFTLRITPSMERYLQWKSGQTGLSKADFLRKEITENVIQKDKTYRDHAKR